MTNAERLDALFDEETTPLLRRLGERDRGAGTSVAVDRVAAQTRTQVWAALATAADVTAPADPRTLTWLLTVAQRLGAALFQSPFLDTVFAADLLVTADAADAELLAQIPAGRRRIAMALRDRGTSRPSAPAPVTVAPGGTWISATRAFVAFAADVDDLLVVGARDGRLCCALVPVDQPGVGMRRLDDVGRGELYTVVLDRAGAGSAVVDVGDCYPQVLARARLRHAGYLLGCATGALRLTTHHLRARTAFGAPLAQNTALAYRLAALAAEIEAVRAFAEATAQSAGGSPATAAQVLLLAAQLARQAAEEAVHLHGAFGMTERCDAQVFYRRVAVDAQWLGTPPELCAEAAARLREDR